MIFTKNPAKTSKGNTICSFHPGFHPRGTNIKPLRGFFTLCYFNYSLNHYLTNSLKKLFIVHSQMPGSGVCTSLCRLKCDTCGKERRKAMRLYIIH